MSTLLVQFVLVGLTMFLIGFVLGRDTKHPIDVADIDGYMQEHYPTTWAAYHRGITEGYQQGMRDAREDE